MIPDRMRALVLHGPGDLRFEEVPIPEVPEGFLLLRVAWCGVCGSDIPRIFQTGAHRHPLIPGHEFAGTVAATGVATKGWRIGQAATVFPLIWCGRCASCEVGRYAQCTDYDYLGSRRDGAFAEYVLCPERNAVPVPHGVPIEHAAMTEPAAVALHALRRAGRILTGATVAVFGAGPIGNLVAQWARIMGAGMVALFDVQEERIATARRMGFRTVFHSGQVKPLMALQALTGGPGADICVEAAGVPVTVVEAIRCAQNGGTVVLLGNPTTHVELPREVVSLVLRKELHMAGVWNSTFSMHGGGDDWQTALSAMAAGRLQLDPLITHRVPLAEGPEMLTAMAERRGTFGKVLIGGSIGSE